MPLTWTRYTRIQVPTTLTLTFAPDPSAVIAATGEPPTQLPSSGSWSLGNSRVFECSSSQLRLLHTWLATAVAAVRVAYPLLCACPCVQTSCCRARPRCSAAAAADDVVTELRQEMSLPDLLWWNPAWNWVNSWLWGPVSGRVLSQLVQLQDPFVSR